MRHRFVIICVFDLCCGIFFRKSQKSVTFLGRNLVQSNLEMRGCGDDMWSIGASEREIVRVEIHFRFSIATLEMLWQKKLEALDWVVWTWIFACGRSRCGSLYNWAWKTFRIKWGSRNFMFFARHEVPLFRRRNHFLNIFLVPFYAFGNVLFKNE